MMVKKTVIQVICVQLNIAIITLIKNSRIKERVKEPLNWIIPIPNQIKLENKPIIHTITVRRNSLVVMSFIRAGIVSKVVRKYEFEYS